MMRVTVTTVIIIIETLVAKTETTNRNLDFA